MYSIDASPCSATYIMSYLCSIFTSRLANVLLSRLMGSSRSACGQTKKAIQPGIKCTAVIIKGLVCLGFFKKTSLTCNCQPMTNLIMKGLVGSY